jgi:hypothetical protein
VSNPAFQDLLTRLRDLEEEIEEAVDQRRAKFRYHIDHKRVVFEAEMRKRHRAARIRLGAFLRRTRPLVVLTAPVIYSLIIPFVLIDLFVTVYQAVCFPVYGIAKVRRRDYVVIDRHALGYLNSLQKLNCVYCGYGNGVIAYVREVAGRTERYWCPIKHAFRVRGTHDHYPEFFDFGDADAFRTRLDEMREKLRDAPPPLRSPTPPGRQRP